MNPAESSKQAVQVVCSNHSSNTDEMNDRLRQDES